jgi:arylsulfatase
MLGAVRIDDFKFQFLQQPYGWPGEKTDMPVMTNIRQDPFEGTSMIRGETAMTGALRYGMDFHAREFWRFVLVQQQVARLASTAIDYPPMQDLPPSIWMRSRLRSPRPSKRAKVSS